MSGECPRGGQHTWATIIKDAKLITVCTKCGVTK